MVEELQVGDPESVDPYPPLVQIVGPEPDSCITAPTDLVASITDDTPSGLGSGPVEWTVRFAPLDSDSFTVIGSGVGEVDNGVIARFDPTMLKNDAYRFEVIALLQPGHIADCARRRVGMDAAREAEALVRGAGCAHRLHVGNEFGHVKRGRFDFWPIGLDLGVVQDVVDQAQQ